MKKNQLIIDLSQYPELEDVSREYLESSIYKLLMLIALSNGKKFLLPRVDIQPEPIQYVEPEDKSCGVDGILGRTSTELVKDMLDHSAKMSAMKSPPVDPNVDSLILLRFLSILHMGPNAFLDRLFYTEEKSFKETLDYWRNVVELPNSMTMMERHNALAQVGLSVVGTLYHCAHFSEDDRSLSEVILPASVDDLLLELKEHGFELAGPALSSEGEDRYDVAKFVEEQLVESMKVLLLRLTRKGEHDELTRRVLDDCRHRRFAVLHAKSSDVEEYDYTKHYPDLALMRFMFALNRGPDFFTDNMFLGAPDLIGRKKKFREFIGKRDIYPDGLESIGMLEIGTVYGKVFDAPNHDPIDITALNAELANGHFPLGDDGFNERIVGFVAGFVKRNWNYSGTTPVSFLKERISVLGGEEVLSVFLGNVSYDRKRISTEPPEEVIDSAKLSQENRRNIVAFLALIHLDYNRFCNVLFEGMSTSENNDALMRLRKDLAKALDERKVLKVAPNLYRVVSYRYRKSHAQPTQSQVEGAVRELCNFTSSDWLGKQIPDHIINDFCQLYVAVNVNSESEDATNPVTLVQGRVFSHFPSIYEYATSRLPE